MRNKRFIFPFVLLMLSLAIPAKTRSVSLDYHAPSKTWMGSLPIGNGRLGAMVYGGTDNETIALNEVTMWSGQPDPDVNNLCGPEHLKEIRQAFFNGDFAKGNDLGTRYLSGHDKSFGTNLPFGDLLVAFSNRQGSVSNYHRTLEMNTGIADVSYEINGKKYVNEYFCSNPANVLVANYTSSAKNDISATISMRMLRNSKVVATDEGLEITGDATFDKNGPGGVKFYSFVRIINEGGEKDINSDNISITNANKLTVIVDIRTDFEDKQYKQLCEKTISKAESLGYKSLKSQHATDFSRLFERMDIDLGGSDKSNTDVMFAEAHSGKCDPAFDALFFQYGRYMLISSSRENSPLPAHLQGVWNDNLACNMPWTCDYHLDINIEQNYWSANIANLAECNYPLFKYLELLAKYGHETAEKVYGCDGWVAHTVNNIWGDTAPGGGVGWGLNVTAGAWMATQLWVHYEYTQDKDYLRNIGYPLLKETAKFFVDYMVTDPNNGYLVTGPSISPENTFRMKDGSVWCLSMMPTIDRAVVYDIYKACIESSKILGIDDDFRARLEKDIKRLPPLALGSNGELKEWLMDVDRADIAHRHSSHLLALYPFGQISPVHTPELAQGCAKFLKRQLSQKNWEDTEWTRGNNINYYARLKDGNKAHESLTGLYTGFMRENLMTVSPKGVAGANEDIFSFDATEAAVSGMCEMLLQSYDGYLDFLPALPECWLSGCIKGICARGGIVADIEWKDGKVTKVVLRSNNDQTVKCKINGQMKTIILRAGKYTRI